MFFPVRLVSRIIIIHTDVFFKIVSEYSSPPHKTFAYIAK